MHSNLHNIFDKPGNKGAAYDSPVVLLRKVPLSEGRIEQSNGTLMCSFHGESMASNLCLILCMITSCQVSKSTWQAMSTHQQESHPLCMSQACNRTSIVFPSSSYCLILRRMVL